MKAKLLSLQPRRGRGPAFLKFEEGDFSTFDGALIQSAASMVGGIVEADIQNVEKNGKQYRNVVGLRLIEAPALPAAPESVVPISATPETVSTVSSHAAYLAFDRADDALIAERLKGRSLSAMVYHFKQQGQDVYGLGVDGAEACKREMAKNGEIIDEESVKLEKDTDREAYFLAKATRYAYHGATRVMLDSAIGSKRQSKWTPSGSANPFWFEQGCTKAMRNAILRLTPELIKQQVIEAYQGVAIAVTAEEASEEAVPPTRPLRGLPPSAPLDEEPTTSGYKAFKTQVMNLQQEFEKGVGLHVFVDTLGGLGYERLSQVPAGEYGKVIATLFTRLKKE